MELNGIAHIQLTANDAARSLPFWERLCHFFEMKTLLKNESMVYCIGSRTGVLVREAPPEKRGARFDQNQVGLHHLCFRARAREQGPPSSVPGGTRPTPAAGATSPREVT